MEKPSNSIDLFEFSREYGALSPESAVVIIKQVLETSFELYNNRIFHRDIKDENILLNYKTLETRLIDFGCATQSRDQNQTFSNFSGTPEFTAPEYYLTGKLDQEKSTIWSIGCLLYILLFGDIPFETTNDIISGKRDKFDESSLSISIKTLLDNMLQNNPANRLSFEQILNDPILN